MDLKKMSSFNSKSKTYSPKKLKLFTFLERATFITVFSFRILYNVVYC